MQLIVMISVKSMLKGNIILYLKTNTQGKKFLFCSISIKDSSSRNSPI